MTFDMATYTLTVPEASEIRISALKNALPYQDSEHLTLKIVEETSESLTVAVSGDAYVIPMFEEELPSGVEIVSCDVDIGGGSAASS
jgi:hypothetical protein